MISRRSVMKLFGGGALAGRQAAKAALEAANINAGGNAAGLGSQFFPGAIGHGSPVPSGIEQETYSSRIRKALKELMASKGDRIAETVVHGLDVDIASMQSWSAAYKVSRMRYRIADREFNNTRRYLMKELENALRTERS